VSRVPKTTIMMEDSKAGQVMSFLDQLEQLDDVQHVYSNADFSDSALQGLEQA
jgi:transcriptional/translational regulatory protein YebC/TACO1